MKNIFIKLIIAVAKCLQKEKASSARRSFLIVSTTGLGDTLWGTPALRALRNTYPTSTISVLTSPIGQEVFENNPHINWLFVWGKKPMWRLFIAMRPLRFDTILIFHTSQRAVLPFCYFLGASEIVGTEKMNKGLDEILTTAVPQAHIHEIERRLKVVAKVGARPSDFSMELYLHEESEKEASAFLNQNPAPSYIPLIGLHPGAKDGFKQWPPEHFIEVGNRLVDHLGCQIIVTGNASEKQLVEEIASKIKGAIPATELTLKGLAALMKKMAVVITNDTGPMHVAFAVKTSTVAIFCATDPKLCGPYSLRSKVQVIHKPVTCSPCLRKRCREPFCLLQIPPQDVYDATLTLYYHA
jgi:ADP-heptose:LPS heptosyltransferase